MPEYYSKNDSLECHGANTISKKIVESCPLNHHIIGRCIKYVCTRDGICEITKESNPKISKLENTLAKLNLGGTLKSNAFYVLVEGFRIKKISKINFSGQHNANTFLTNSEYTFAQITIPFPKIIDLLLPENYIRPIDNLSKKQVEVQ